MSLWGNKSTWMCHPFSRTSHFMHRLFPGHKVGWVNVIVLNVGEEYAPKNLGLYLNSKCCLIIACFWIQFEYLFMFWYFCHAMLPPPLLVCCSCAPLVWAALALLRAPLATR